MLPALALAPLTLAAVLVLSGLAKLPDSRSTHSMMTLLRLPGVVANAAVARLLPWAELTVAALLLTPWRWTFALGSLAAVLLFLAFWVLIARAMTFDPRPTCACFGRVGDHRITGRTVIRNTILLTLALVTAVVALLGGTATGLLAAFDAGDWAWLLLTVTLAAVTVLVLGTRGDQGAQGPQAGAFSAHVTSQQPGTATSAHKQAGTPAGPVADGLLVDRDLEVIAVGRLAAQQAQLLVLADCWCGSTMVTIDRLPDWRERLPDLGVQLVHTHVPWKEPRLHHLPGVWWDPGARVYSDLQAGASPAAVLVDTRGRVMDGPVNGVEAIEHLVARLSTDVLPSGAGDPAARARAERVTAPDAPVRADGVRAPDAP
ncbi:MauE/DoxX family redox-associated membrane protein [Ornithinimicrobium pratense]|uniref:Methylamine utilisation protein MauE domain-containing protein n=1 Tax=Ornithinimicrobium pratense TaxID=2593973 RepID=A0A5J6V687_9MICO|nr:MauE/DoxX family redox-associated membrane protein [Ornithinimicrobium pratense]QFG69288.1 hypothetical protein FY030_11755 [Ornithinimicrobium pratense]